MCIMQWFMYDTSKVMDAKMLNYTNHLFEEKENLKEAQTKCKLTLGYLKT